MRQRVGVILLLTLALLTLVVVVGAGPAMGNGDSAPESTQPSGYAPIQDQPDPDNTITRIELAADGSATWQLTFRTRLATDDDRAEYERFQESFRENSSRYLEPFETRMTGVVDRANESHAREMRATAFTAETTIQEVPRRWGIVTFQFTWDGFAATDGDRVVAGDVFDGGFYIGEDDVLEVAAPEGFVLAEADPTPHEFSASVLEWRGREDFADGRPRVVAGPAESTTSMQQNEAEEQDEAIPGMWSIGGLVTLLIGFLAAVLYAVRTGRLELPTDRGGDDDGSEPSEQRPASTTATATDSDRDPLLTDEDRVQRTLREQGGRMKQSAVVEELGWSKSKTSRILSKMADDGTIEKLQLGRENVIDLSDDE